MFITQYITISWKLAEAVLEVIATILKKNGSIALPTYILQSARITHFSPSRIKWLLENENRFSSLKFDARFWKPNMCKQEEGRGGSEPASLLN